MGLIWRCFNDCVYWPTALFYSANSSPESPRAQCRQSPTDVPLAYIVPLTFDPHYPTPVIVSTYTSGVILINLHCRLFATYCN